MASISARYDRDKNLIGWRAQVRRRGHKPEVKTFRRRTEAEQWARAIEAEIDGGRFVSRAEAERTTLSELLERYGREVTPRKSGADAETSRIRTLSQSPLAPRTVATITSSDIAKWRDLRLREVEPGSVRREMVVLGHVFSVAMREWGIHLPSNPAAQVARPRVDDARDRRLAPEEESALIEHARQYQEGRADAVMIEQIIRLALNTALRRGEIAAMRWEHINLSRRSLLIPGTQKGAQKSAPRTIPLSSKSLEILSEIPRRLDGWVWGRIRADSITQAFERVCDRAGITDLHFHDLRHEAISRWFENTDLDIMEISRITGHKTLQMLSRYTHLRADRLADRLDGKQRGRS